MKKRETLLEKFSNFLLLEKNGIRWHCDPRLLRNMTVYCQNDPTANSEEYWAIFFQQRYLNHEDKNNLARGHLYAYLQEPCYWAATDIYQKYQARLDYQIEDYFNEGILDFDAILADFKPLFSTSLDNFATQRIKYRLIDRIRQISQAFGHNTWSLLLNSTGSRLTQALTARGLVGETLENHLLAWDYYQEIYARARIKTDGKIQEPSAEIWQKITDAYNCDPNSTIKIDRITTAQWLKEAGQAIFDYLFPQGKTISLQKTFGGEDSNTREEMIEDNLHDTPWQQLEAAENWRESQQNHQKILAWLQGEVKQLCRQPQQEKLHPQIQLILEMKYVEELNQVTIAAKITEITGVNPALKQYQISRELDKVYRHLAKKFLAWAAENLHIPFQSHDREVISEAIESWLKYYYQTSATTQED
jgi:DNA-directed RNA polymerase specialized sigma subunit